jgi:hypothetical protein
MAAVYPPVARSIARSSTSSAKGVYAGGFSDIPAGYANQVAVAVPKGAVVKAVVRRVTASVHNGHLLAGPGSASGGALRDEGMSKERAAKISNAQAGKSKKGKRSK